MTQIPAKSKSSRTRKSSAKAVASKKPAKRVRASEADAQESAVLDLLHLAQLRAEKCELGEAREAYLQALEKARELKNLKLKMESIAGLLRLAGEALDEEAIRRWGQELDRLMAAYPKQIPAMAWYCKGAVARHQKSLSEAQRCFHRYLNLVRTSPKSRWEAPWMSGETLEYRGWLMLATVAWLRGKGARARFLCEILLQKTQDGNIRGMVYLLLGDMAEREAHADRNYSLAMELYQKAHASFLSEHSWYYHLYVLLAYARLNRLQRNYAQAYLHLDLIEKVMTGPEFGLLRRAVSSERDRLESDAVDLLIDSRQCLIQTRESGKIDLKKQYVLLSILEALSDAHGGPNGESEHGLSKAEIIERVWNESYRPEAHDNKLYYNINRLRKLIEPDAAKPRYLLNWKQGYRLAPGLRIHYVGARRGVAGLVDSKEGRVK